ncbi:hypothetical protein N7539_003003 [Penicillium diatomitis]|uniref:Uncharacterized protein n=1 Tax=Penicillium diatomitis TaxID=2819901 RepID=A0A9W9XFS5_9EURO|nr:uncharacterized protein N7539_003003 [Penicillium diatomitis]KAJ5491436.1 hypothetical protein N7539_003003 [Penicillium diatomitis]
MRRDQSPTQRGFRLALVQLPTSTSQWHLDRHRQAKETMAFRQARDWLPTVALFSATVASGEDWHTPSKSSSGHAEG